MAPHNPYVQQLDVLDRSSPRFLDQLTTLLGGKECRNHIIGLSNQDAVWLVEYLEDVRTHPICVRISFPKINLDSQHYRSYQLCFPRMPTCTQVDKRHPGSVAGVVYTFKHSLDRRFPPGRLWSCC